jgi:molecular chaperone GrpE (heat shock protein)
MLIAQLRQKIVEYQRRIIELREEARRAQEKREVYLRSLLEGLFDGLDALENICKNFETQAERSSAAGPTDLMVQRQLKSLRRLSRMFLRMLEEHDIFPIELENNQAAIGLCKVLETRPMADQPEGAVIEIVRRGYRRGSHVLRPLEVITVKNP